MAAAAMVAPASHGHGAGSPRAGLTVSPATGMNLVMRSPGGGRTDANEGKAAADLAISIDRTDAEGTLNRAHTGRPVPSRAASADDAADPAADRREDDGAMASRPWWHDGFHTEDPNFVMTQRFHWGYFLRELVFQGLGTLAIPIVLAWDGKNAAINRALIPQASGSQSLRNYFSAQDVSMTFGCVVAVLVFIIAGEDDLPTMYASEFFWAFMCFALRGVVISTKYGLFSVEYRRRLKEEVIDESVFGGTMLFPAWGTPTPEMIDYRLRESTYRLGLDPRLLKFHVPAPETGHEDVAGAGPGVPGPGIVAADELAAADAGAHSGGDVPRDDGTAVDVANGIRRLHIKIAQPDRDTAPPRAEPVRVSGAALPQSARGLLNLKHGPLPELLSMAPCGCCLCHPEVKEPEGVLVACPHIKFRYVEVDAMREANLIAQSAFDKTVPSLVPFVYVCAIFMGLIPSFVRVHEGKPLFGMGGLDTLGIVGVFAGTTVMLTGIWGWAILGMQDVWRRVVALRMHGELGASLALCNLPPTRPRVDSSWLHWFSHFSPSVDFPRWASFSSTCPQNVQTWLHVRRILLDTGGHFAHRMHVYFGYYLVIVMGVVAYVVFRVARGDSGPEGTGTEGSNGGEAGVVIATIDLALSGLVLGVLSVTMIPTLVLGWYANESLRQRDVAMLIGHKFGAQVRLRNSRTPYDAHGEMNDTIDSCTCRRE